LIGGKIDNVINNWIVFQIVRNPNFDYSTLACNEEFANCLATFDLGATKTMVICLSRAGAIYTADALLRARSRSAAFGTSTFGATTFGATTLGTTTIAR
jgi:hypothetical protein